MTAGKRDGHWVWRTGETSVPAVTGKSWWEHTKCSKLHNFKACRESKWGHVCRPAYYTVTQSENRNTITRICKTEWARKGLCVTGKWTLVYCWITLSSRNSYATIILKSIQLLVTQDHHEHWQLLLCLRQHQTFRVRCILAFVPKVLSLQHCSSAGWKLKPILRSLSCAKPCEALLERRVGVGFP